MVSFRLSLASPAVAGQDSTSRYQASRGNRDGAFDPPWHVQHVIGSRPERWSTLRVPTMRYMLRAITNGGLVASSQRSGT